MNNDHIVATLEGIDVTRYTHMVLGQVTAQEIEMRLDGAYTYENGGIKSAALIALLSILEERLKAAINKYPVHSGILWVPFIRFHWSMKINSLQFIELKNLSSLVVIEDVEKTDATDGSEIAYFKFIICGQSKLYEAEEFSQEEPVDALRKIKSVVIDSKITKAKSILGKFFGK